MQPSPPLCAISLRRPRFSLGAALVLCLLTTWLSPAAGLAAQPQQPAGDGPNQETTRQANGFAGSIKLMADELFRHLDDPDPQTGELSRGLAVCSFVDLKKMTRTSSFGRYLAEQLMSEFQQHGYRVVEMRKTSSLLVQEKRGEYGLSRDPEEIADSLAAHAMLTGTYTLAGDHVLVNAKIIDNRNSAMLSSATLIFPRTPLVAKLLSDSVSASTGEQAVVYMKRLEL